MHHNDFKEKTYYPLRKGILDMRGKLQKLVRTWYFWLLVITSIAILVRSIPAWMNAAWGGDFGIYYGLTSRFVQNQQIFNEYNGWGGMYNYFPVLYIFSALGHWITGANLLWLMPKIAPIFGGLTVFIFYFIVVDVTKRRDLALLSSLFLAVIPFHVYQTSHAAPLTMGHFFMMLSMYLFLKSMNNKKYIVPLLISTVLLIMSHHLTTYFFLITIFLIVVIKSMRVDIRKMYRDVCRRCIHAYIRVLDLYRNPGVQHVHEQGTNHPVVPRDPFVLCAVLRAAADYRCSEKKHVFQEESNVFSV